MKKTCSVLLISAIAAFGLLLAAATLTRAQTTKKFEPTQLREDFQIARQSLEEGHSGLYRHTKEADLGRVFDEAEKSLDHPMDVYEFYRVMAPTIAAIKCGHTGLSVPSELGEELERLPRLPFDVKVLDSKPYIFRDYAKRGSLAGMEIQSINGVPAGRIISTMLAASMKDGDTQTTRQRDISGDFGRNLIVLLGLKAPYDVVVATASNKTKRVQVAGLPREEMGRMTKALFPHDQPRDSAELQFLDNGQIARITYPSFGIPVEQGRAFMKRAFEDIRSNRSRTLILDLRGNGGGEDLLGGLLFSYLVDKPFNYYDDVIVNKMSFNLSKYTDPHRDLVIPPGISEIRTDGKVHIVEHDNSGLQQPSKPEFTGTVYILIDGGCLSTTAEFLTLVHFHQRATFIGEESAGAYYGTTDEVAKITLPNTKLGVFIPLAADYMAVDGTHLHDPSRGVIPDFPVQHTIADLLAGRDREFELALQLARGSRN